MASYYIKARARARLERFARVFFVVACVFWLCACIFAGGYTLGQRRGIIDGAQQLNACEMNGGNGYFIDAGGLSCLYE